MSDKEKLDLACSQLKDAIKKCNVQIDIEKKWHAFALRGSVQTLKAKKGANYAQCRTF